MPNDLNQLAAEFFREFARCEYCLKAVGLRKATQDAKANWVAFAAEVRNIIDMPESSELKAAVAYFVDHPPKKQVVRDKLLAWDDKLPDHQGRAELVLLLVCRVRNNLFHGGKFNGHWFEPQRSEDLIRHGLVILRACINGHDKVREAYVQRAV